MDGELPSDVNAQVHPAPARPFSDRHGVESVIGMRWNG